MPLNLQSTDEKDVLTMHLITEGNNNMYIADKDGKKNLNEYHNLNGPIDLVYTWVNGSDPKHIEG